MKTAFGSLAALAAIFASISEASAQISTCTYGEPFEFNNSASIIFTPNASNNRLFEAQAIQNETTFDFSVLDSNSPNNRRLLTPISGNNHNQDGGTATDGGIQLLALVGSTPAADVDVTVNISGGFVTEVEFYGHDIEDDEVATFGTADYVSGTLMPHPGATVGTNATTGVATGTAPNSDGSSDRSAFAIYQNNNGVSALTMNFGVVDGRIGGGFAMGTYCISMIEASPETFPDFSSVGGMTSSILASDSLNGAAIVPSGITLTPGEIIGPDGNPSTAISLSSDGVITVPPNTPGGAYTAAYEICDIVNPTNCDSAIETVTVVPSVPELTVTKTASSIPSSIQPGDNISYSFIIQNSGNTVIENVEPIDTGPTFNAVAGATRAGTNALSDFAIVTESGFIDADTNSDLTVDSLAPGEQAKFTATYELSEIDLAYVRNAGDPTTAIVNSATATGEPLAGVLQAVIPSVVETGVIIPLTARPDLIPDQCGTFLSEGFSDIISGFDEAQISFDSGLNNDPYTYMNFARLPSGKIETYYTSLIGAGQISGDAFTTTPVPELITDDSSNASNAGPENGVPISARSEFYRVAVRFDGKAGTTETVTLQTESAQEHTAYWVTDTSGNVLSSSNFQLTSVNGGGVGNDVAIPLTFPSDGIVYVNIAMLDATLRHGIYTFSSSSYSCPPLLDAVKTVKVFGETGAASYAVPGSDVVYSITVSNSGVGEADAGSMEIIDNMPPEISFWNGDIDFGGPDNFTDTTPVALEQSTGAGLTFDYNTDVRFGFGVTAPADFDSCAALAPDNTYRDDVTFICLNPKGALNGGVPVPTFSVNFRARIK